MIINLEQYHVIGSLFFREILPRCYYFYVKIFGISSFWSGREKTVLKYWCVLLNSYEEMTRTHYNTRSSYLSWWFGTGSDRLGPTKLFFYLRNFWRKINLLWYSDWGDFCNNFESFHPSWWPMLFKNY